MAADHQARAANLRLLHRQPQQPGRLGTVPTVAATAERPRRPGPAWGQERGAGQPILPGAANCHRIILKTEIVANKRLDIGIDALVDLRDNWDCVEHMWFE